MSSADNSDSSSENETPGTSVPTDMGNLAHRRKPTANRAFALRLLPIPAGLALVIFLCSPQVRTLVFLAGALLVYGILILAEYGLSKAPVLAVKVRPQIVLLCASLCLGLCLCEAVIRLFFHQLLPDWDRIGVMGQVIGYDHDPVLGWAPVPGRQNKFDGIGAHPYTAINNSKGLRDGEPALDGRPGLLVLGDSCVWGCDVDADERFTEKLRARHPEWQVYNFGVVGYGTDQEYLLLQRHMAEYHPQVVFLLICTQNDEHDNCTNGGGLVAYKPYFTAGPNGRLQLHGVPVPLSDRLFCLHHPFISKSCLARITMRAWGRLRSPPAPPYNPGITRALIQELRNYVRDHHAMLGVGLTQTYPELEQFLKSCAIPYVSLNTDLTSDTIHWNERGHTFVADKIEEFLARERLIELRAPTPSKLGNQPSR
ncbi:MAG TPA: SGNH/GDSL hydrolase family protein [Verrucomicrobiae bacterium]